MLHSGSRIEPKTFTPRASRLPPVVNRRPSTTSPLRLDRTEPSNRTLPRAFTSTSRSWPAIRELRASIPPAISAPSMCSARYGYGPGESFARSSSKVSLPLDRSMVASVSRTEPPMREFTRRSVPVLTRPWSR